MHKLNKIKYIISALIFSIILFNGNIISAQSNVAEENFNQIMNPQNESIDNLSEQGYKGNIVNSKNKNILKSTGETDYSDKSGGQNQDAKIDVSIDRYQNIRKQLQKIRAARSKNSGPAVILGSSEYTGKIINGSLALRLKLQVTLGRSGVWKTVPLAGDNVVLVNATINNQSIPVSRQNSYHVWVTKITGEATIFLDILIPPHGPRGSIEYDFHVVKTPVTLFSCQFPAAGLEPRLNAAIESKSISRLGGTYFQSSLRPTTRIHIIGFKDLGTFDQREAKLYSEVLNLLSIEKNTLELFSVIKYTILYGGTKEFNIILPENTTLISADGMGAFRYTLKKLDKGTLLKGETAFPIRNNYEISLRLKKEHGKGGRTFQIPVPECQGTERQSGWIGIEVPGKMELKPEKQDNVQIIDIRQLPHDLHNSAVSPILKAYLYHNVKPSIDLSATVLPEIEPDTGSIDSFTCHTKITPAGKTISNLRITLRNRLRHSLILKLPENASVTSAQIDNEPINLSKTKEGNIIIPLKRSIGSNKLYPFTISIIMENNIGSMSIFGSPTLNLPTIDLPISSLHWVVYLPKKNIYSGLKGDIKAQNYLGQMFWQRSSNNNDTQQQIITLNNNSLSQVELSSTGAVPVRFKIPKNGIALKYTRYWIEKNEPIKISFYYMRSWLNMPFRLLAVALLLSLILYNLKSYRTNKIPAPINKLTLIINKKINKDKNLIANILWVIIYLITILICITLSNLSTTILILIIGIIICIYQLKLYFVGIEFLIKLIKNVKLNKMKNEEKFSFKKFIIHKTYLVTYIFAFIILISLIIKFLSILSNPLHG